MTTFAELNLNPLLLSALEQAGHITPTPIQAQAIPPAMQGRDILGIAQTGTGKTAAFALPILHQLALTGGHPPRGGCRVLVLSPTRELASQIAESFKSYGRHMGFSVATVFGGVGHAPQQRALARGVDILVATPGRLMDHMQTRNARLDHTQILVLDEADQMLDQGFLPAITKIVAAVPKERRTMFFSATMPSAIAQLASKMLIDPVRVEVTPVATTAERVNQRVIILDGASKRGVLAGILRGEGVGRVLVFSRTKHGADKIVKSLEMDGFPANAIHGNKGQSQRERALAEFKSGKAPILVATDIAARGIDVPDVTHVIQHELPEVAETYVHRIGRTARAGAGGQAIALVAPDEIGLLRAIERLTRQKIDSEDQRSNPTIPLNERAVPTRPQRGRQGQPQQQRGGGGKGGERQEQRSSQPSRPAQERSYVKPMNDGARKRPAAPGGSAGRSFMARGR
ncbi:MAG: helicase [Rubritepida sp.]|nr:helicase [Rubritepida sp.]